MILQRKPTELNTKQPLAGVQMCEHVLSMQCLKVTKQRLIVRPLLHNNPGERNTPET